MNVTFEVDHTIPEKMGGMTYQENLAYAYPLCNGFKAARIRGTNPASGEEVSLFHPRKQNWDRHFRWLADRITIEGRTKNGRATVLALQLKNPNFLRYESYGLQLGVLHLIGISRNLHNYESELPALPKYGRRRHFLHMCSRCAEMQSETNQTSIA